MFPLKLVGTELDDLRPPDRALASAPGGDDDHPGGEKGAAYVQS
jgi:hypothetical protein